MEALREFSTWLLFIHIGSAVLALGPVFIYVHIRKAAIEEPAHAIFAMRLARSISEGWAHPLALVLIASGFALIWSLGYDVLSTGWLLVAVVLYLGNFTYANLVNNRDLARMLELIESGPPASLSAHDRAELATRRRRTRYAGIYMRSVLAIVLFLMIAKPF